MPRERPLVVGAVVGIVLKTTQTTAEDDIVVGDFTLSTLCWFLSGRSSRP
jgi:hypothetical protein